MFPSRQLEFRAISSLLHRRLMGWQFTFPFGIGRKREEPYFSSHHLLIITFVAVFPLLLSFGGISVSVFTETDRGGKDVGTEGRKDRRKERMTEEEGRWDELNPRLSRDNMCRGKYRVGVLVIRQFGLYSKELYIHLNRILPHFFLML